MQKTLKYMCQTEHYRTLSNWSYEINPEPLGEENGNADYTDVIIHCLKKYFYCTITIIVFYSLGGEVQR